MSLDFNIGGIADRKTHFPPDEQGKMNDTLHVLIWNALAIDVGTITLNNVDEVWYRTAMWQTLIGTQFNRFVPQPYELIINSDGSAGVEMHDEGHGTWEPFLLTREDIVHAVGLHTNVSTTTRTQFIKKVTGRFDPNR